MKKSLKEVLDSFKLCLDIVRKTSWMYTLLRVMGKIAMPLCGVALSFLSRDLIQGLAENKSMDFFMTLILQMLVLYLLNLFLSKLLNFVQETHNLLIEKELQTRLMRKTLKADIAFFDDPRCMDAHSFANKNVFALSSLLWTMIDTISSIVSLVIILISISSIDVSFAIVILAATVPSSIASQILRKKSFKLSEEQVNIERNRGYYSGFMLNKRYAADIRTLGIEKFIEENYLKFWKEIFFRRKSLSKHKAIFGYIFESLPLIASTYVLARVVSGVIHNILSLGDVSFWLSISGQLRSAISALILNILNIYENKLQANSLATFEKLSVPQIGDGPIAIDRIDTIEFVDVCFAYPGTQKVILKHVSFSVKRGELLILVGENASGKSTIIKLIMRLYDITSGKILINGICIKDFNLQMLRKCMSVYFQEGPNYAFTIKENIELSNLLYTNNKSAIQNALQQSNAEPIVNRAVAGLNSYVYRFLHKDGIELSGGESQKIALARAFFRDASVVILDEPSSALDPMSEDIILSSILENAQRRLTILTSHRLSIAVHADKIILMQNGCIIESGTHAKLMKTGRTYYDLYLRQSSKYEN